MAGPEQDEQRQEGVSLTGIAYDKELYDGGSDRFAGYTQSIGVGEDDEQDEREQALARCALCRMRLTHSRPAAQCMPILVHHNGCMLY